MVLTRHRAVGEEGEEDWQEELPPGGSPTDAQRSLTAADRSAADTAAAVAAARVVLRWMRGRREREAQRSAAEAAWDGDEVSSCGATSCSTSGKLHALL